MAGILEGDTDASRLSVNGSVCATGKNIRSQSSFPAEGSVLIQDLSDMVGFVFVRTEAKGVSDFVHQGA
jgi:hypothetical protein